MANELTKRIMANMVSRCQGAKTFTPAPARQQSNMPQNLHLTQADVENLTGLIHKEESPAKQNPRKGSTTVQKQERPSYLDYQQKLRASRSQSLSDVVQQRTPSARQTAKTTISSKKGTVGLDEYIQRKRK